MRLKRRRSPFDPVDDALHLEIDGAGQLSLLEPAVDVVFFFFHVRILGHKTLDVKRL
jgi:hypothetical protein